MNGETISRALNGLPEEMIAEAIQPARRLRRPLWIRIAACAAVLAIVLLGLFGPFGTEAEYVTAPGILKVYAYDGTTENEIADMLQNELTGGVTSYRPVWSPYINVACGGIPLYFEIPEDYFGEAEITFEITVDQGEFFEARNTTLPFGNITTIGNKKKIYWDGVNLSKIREEVGNGGVFYADILIRADGKIVGYGVIEFTFCEEPVPACIIRSFKTVCFPMVDDCLQDVPEKYVFQQIIEVKSRA